MYRTYIKRGLDVLLSAAGLLILSPLLVMLALLVVLDDPGPVFFTQKRYGRDHRLFTIYKFRSMSVSAPHETPTGSLEGAERYMTRWQRFFRSSSLDELPQLWNILRGDMSLIGPRPLIEAEAHVVALREANGSASLRPGLTGWAQINGRDEICDTEKARLDGEYAQKLSFAFDCKCLLLTVGKVLRREGVVEGHREKKPPRARRAS